MQNRGFLWAFTNFSFAPSWMWISHHLKQLLFLYFLSYSYRLVQDATQNRNQGNELLGLKIDWGIWFFVTFGISFPIHPDTFLFLLNFSASLKRDEVPFNHALRDAVATCNSVGTSAPTMKETRKEISWDK